MAVRSKRSRRAVRPDVPAGLLLGRTMPEAAAPVGFTRTEPAGAPGGLVTLEGEGHLLTFAPTGGGKGVGPLMCNLLTHPGQAIVLDIKGEAYDVTHQRRRDMGQRVCRIDLRDGMSADSLNPLDLASGTGQETAVIARTLACDLVDRTGMERERFWNDWAETVLAGGLAYLMDDAAPENRNLGHLFDLLTDDDPCYRIAAMLDSKQIRNVAAVKAMGIMLGLSERDTRPSVLASAQAPLRLFDSALIRQVTATTSIPLDELVDGAPMTIYIVVPAARLAPYRPLLRLFISGLMHLLMQRRRPPPDRTLVLCDEMGNLGRIEALVTAFTLARSASVTVWGLLQNVAQLQIYGTDARTILDNAAILQLFRPRNGPMAQDYAQLLGSVSPDEVMTLTPDEQYLLVDGGKPQRTKRLRYFAEPELVGLFGQSEPKRSR